MCFIFVYPLPLGPGCTSFYTIREDLTMDSHSYSAALNNRAVIAWHLLVRRRKRQRKPWRMEAHKAEEHLQDRRGTPARRHGFAGARRSLTCWPWGLRMFRRAVSLIATRFKKSFGQFNFLECFFFIYVPLLCLRKPIWVLSVWGWLTKARRTICSVAEDS